MHYTIIALNTDMEGSLNLTLPFTVNCFILLSCYLCLFSLNQNFFKPQTLHHSSHASMKLTQTKPKFVPAKPFCISLLNGLHWFIDFSKVSISSYV